ncbi:phospholipase A2 GL16-1-like [Aulostomus maculatus]
MILCTVPDSWPVLDYANYGCYCGLGGSGTPVDELDWCRTPRVHVISDTVKVQIIGNTTTFPCGDNSPCEKFICECDRKAATCFAGADYKDENAHLPSGRCK